MDKAFTSKACGGTNSQVRMDANKAGTKLQYRVALAAFMAGKGLKWAHLPASMVSRPPHFCMLLIDY